MSLQVEIFIEHVLNGLTLGALYAVVTMGLALIFGVARLVNFAYGDLFMIGGYSLFLLLTWDAVDIPYPIIVVLVVLITAAFSLLLERIAIRPIVNKSWRVHAVATLGISIILQNLAQIQFTSDPKQTPTSISRQIVTPFGIRMSLQRVVILVVVIVVFIGLNYFIHHTRLGKAIRAVSQNREMCEVVGIDVGRIILITFVISGGLAGLAGALVSPLFSVVPTMGSQLTLKGLAAVILGGLGRLNGAVYAAFFLGMVEALFAGYVEFAYRDAVAFGVFIIILLVRPQGVFGRKVGL
jgi:branched-chain amino acid transport system permease protein